MTDDSKIRGRKGQWTEARQHVDAAEVVSDRYRLAASRNEVQGFSDARVLGWVTRMVKAARKDLESARARCEIPDLDDAVVTARDYLDDASIYLSILEATEEKLLQRPGRHALAMSPRELVEWSQDLLAGARSALESLGQDLDLVDTEVFISAVEKAHVLSEIVTMMFEEETS